MSEQEYTHRLEQLEADRRGIVGEMMKRPFGDRVMASHLESELDAIECELLDHPPIIEHSDTGEPLYGGKGLRADTPEEIDAVKHVPPLFMETIPQSEWPSYIEGKGGEDQLTIKPYVKHILSQGSIGSCAGEGVSGLIMAMENQAGQSSTHLNGYFPYHWTSGGVDQGSSLSANIRVAQERGVASVDTWSRSQGFRREPSEKAKYDALQHRLLAYEKIPDWDHFGTALLLSLAVYFGYPGHAILAVRLLAPDRLEYANSWSPQWGENGFGTLNMRRIAWGYGAYAALSNGENRQ